MPPIKSVYSAGAFTLLLCATAVAHGDEPDDLQMHGFLALSPLKEIKFSLEGYLRVRGELWNDLDLSRGPTPSGQSLFPTPAAGGSGHTLTAADMRLRLEPKLEIGQAVRIRMRVDVLDNVGWGSTPDVLPGTYSFASTQAASPQAGVNSLVDAVRVKQAWGEVTLPFGTLAAGRMGSLVPWGTGFFINNGDCIDCDHGDSGDRVMLSVPLFGHYLSALYELTASGPYQNISGQNIDIDRRAHVNTWALIFARYDSPEAQRRKLAAGRTLLQYGLIGTYRYQDWDAPGWMQANGFNRTFGQNDFVARGLRSFSGDLWFLFHRKGWRAELEFATILASIDDISTLPGVAFRQSVTAQQFGGVASLSYSFHLPIRLRCEIGFASGDSAPGFGTGFRTEPAIVQKGDFDGPQLRPPADRTIDNFRFHPDYHVDLILWRRIIGQITDAVYIRPSVRVGPFGSAYHHFSFELAGIDSNSIYGSTPPGQANHLGFELDGLARYQYELGFDISLRYGVLIPGAGFRNLELHRDPSPAQALELVLAYRM